ncbi:MAG: hypothetical protein IH939_06225 [Acidobacteria bacterium]|nr:hypothetical protein [Acidobacteriota bacterium]
MDVMTGRMVETRWTFDAVAAECAASTSASVVCESMRQHDRGSTTVSRTGRALALGDRCPMVLRHDG